MIAPKSSDLLHAGVCVAHRLRWVHADVSDCARDLGRRHLCGPTAGLALAEALAGVALLGGDLTLPGETVSLRLRVGGPLGGILVETARDGALRGCTRVTSLHDLDEEEEIRTEEALGDRGEAQVIRSLPERILSRTSIEVCPASVQGVVERFRGDVLRRPAFVVLTAFPAYDGSVDLARAFLVERLPGGDRREFARLRRRADDGSLLEALEAAHGFAGVCEELGMKDVRVDPPRRLRVGCRCSLARAETLLGMLPRAKLAAMAARAAAGKPATVRCHLCGRNFRLAAPRLAALLAERHRQTSGEDRDAS